MTLTPLSPPLIHCPGTNVFWCRASPVPSSEVRLGQARGDKPWRKETEERRLTLQGGVSGGTPTSCPGKGLRVRAALSWGPREPGSFAELRDLTQGGGKGQRLVTLMRRGGGLPPEEAPRGPDFPGEHGCVFTASLQGLKTAQLAEALTPLLCSAWALWRLGTEAERRP